MRHRRPGLWIIFTCAGGVFGPATSALAAPPLHVEIDQALASLLPHELLPQADDAEFLRRTSLDLIGRVPSSSKVKSFLSDPSPQKREALVDQLLSGAEHPRHMQRVFDVWLMQRRIERHVSRDQWHGYLQNAFAANRPWNEMVWELLAADGTNLEARGPARFFLDRECKTEDLVRDISSVFLGRNLHCAQCHDHPIISDYKQSHFFGIAAFLDRSFLFDDKARVIKLVAEKGEGETAFTSALTQVRGVTPPQVFDGPSVVEPVIAAEAAYLSPAGDGLPPIPRFSRRAELPKAVISHPAFSRNIVNRLWAHLFGRGIVEPVDQDHEGNPPLHPELLNLLAQRFVEGGYDLRMLLRELALTQLYGRAGDVALDDSHASSHRIAVRSPRKLTPEQLTWSWLEATGRKDAELKAILAEQQTEDPKWAALLTGSEAMREALLGRRLAPEAEKMVQAFVTSLPGETSASETTAQQALYIMNGASLQQMLAMRPGNLLDRLSQTASNREMAEELFLSILSRMPTSEEVAWVENELADSGPDRMTKISDLAEAMLTSIEFRFNH